MININCSNCNKEFKVFLRDIKRVKHHYCSKQCMIDAYRTKIKGNCDYLIIPYDMKMYRHHFCSQDCYKKSGQCHHEIHSKVVK